MNDSHDEIKFLRERVKTLEAQNQEFKNAVEDWATIDFSDDGRTALQRATDKFRILYLRYCMSAERRKECGWLLPEDAQ